MKKPWRIRVNTPGEAIKNLKYHKQSKTKLNHVQIVWDMLYLE